MSACKSQTIAYLPENFFLFDSPTTTGEIGRLLRLLFPLLPGSLTTKDNN